MDGMRIWQKSNVEIIVSENPANPICFIKLHLKQMAACYS